MPADVAAADGAEVPADRAEIDVLPAIVDAATMPRAG